MINIEKLNDVLKDYKKVFVDKTWQEENYKWKAVKTFQDNWDADAEDFSLMLNESLKDTDNLLASNMHLPKLMITQYASLDPEFVRYMFESLFDENIYVYQRINDFKNRSQELSKRYENLGRSHYQTENSISTYLWLRYPDKYYIYKFGEVKSVNQVLESDYIFKMGAYKDNYLNSLALYNEICDELKKDEELVTLFKSQLDDTYYPDPQLRTLTIDIGFFMSRNYSKKTTSVKDSEWLPTNYSPNISKEEWINLLKNENIFDKSSLEIMKRFKNIGSMATCTQLSNKYGESANFYNSNSVALAKRVASELGVKLLKERAYRYWPILYLGKKADSDTKGTFNWKLRDELSEALDEVDLSNVNLYSISSETKQNKNYWWLNANPKIWDIRSLEIGEHQTYTTHNERGNKRRIHQYFSQVEIGDIVIGYTTTPSKQIEALMEITKGIHIASDGKESIEFVKVENIAEPITYTNLQNIRGLESCEPLINNQGSLFKLTEEEYEIILSAIEDLQPELPKTNPSYSFEDLHNDLGIKKKTLETWLEAIRAKKQAIFFGPPGTGKTFIVKHLAKYLIQDGLGFSEIVQFHPTYSYEDFIQGIRPIIDNGNLVFELRDGKLLTFCKKAQQTNDFSVLVIDEINRANLSKVFGELMYLLEYRDEKVSLSSGIDFSIPNNVLIIGTMNTADRSIALVDFALRRRFAFIELEPNYDLLKSFLDSSELKKVDIYELVDLLRSINSKIEDKNYFLGTSFFLNKELDKYLKTIWKMEIEPYLEEYFFANPELVDQFRWEKVKAKVLL